MGWPALDVPFGTPRGLDRLEPPDRRADAGHGLLAAWPGRPAHRFRRWGRHIKCERCGSLYFGSNPFGQAPPTYIESASCALTEPTDLADLGYPDVHVVMVVNGQSDSGGMQPQTIAKTTSCNAASIVCAVTLGVVPNPPSVSARCPPGEDCGNTGVPAGGNLRVVLTHVVGGEGCSCDAQPVRPIVAVKVAAPVNEVDAILESVTQDCP